MSFNLTLLSSILFAMGLILVVWIFFVSLKNIRRKRTTKTNTQRTTLIKIVFFCMGLVLIMISQFFFWINSNLNAYIPVETDKPIGVISFEHQDGSQAVMNIAARNSGTHKMIPIEVIMWSDAVVLELEVIRFPKTLSFLNLGDFHRISAVKFIGDIGTQSNSITGKKIQKNAETLWRFFHKVSSIIPAVTTSKITSDPIFFEQGINLNVYSSTSRVILSE